LPIPCISMERFPAITPAAREPRNSTHAGVIWLWRSGKRNCQV
jgi:hypothetical protein